MWKKLQSEIDKLFSKVTASMGYKKPFSEISQNKNQIRIGIKLPDVAKKDIMLEVHKDNIEIKAEKRKKKVKKTKKSYKKIETYKGFYRKIPLPPIADYEKAKAIFKKDTLSIIIPKKKKLVNQIKIK